MNGTHTHTHTHTHKVSNKKVCRKIFTIPKIDLISFSFSLMMPLAADDVQQPPQKGHKRL
jgi:hypothetical protein